jgi:histone arginine demethylase JMJD6
MIIGPAGSGSNIHIDPLGTSAWNMLLLGRKLWVLFPPDTRESDIKSGEEEKEKERDFCAAGWFCRQLPSLSAEVYARRVQFVQHAGETVFVPEGWWHAVLNLDTTLAVSA